MKNRIIFLTVAAFLWISVFSISAQPVVVKATIDSTQILIGEQTKIHLEIAANKGQALQIPVISDTLMANVEVLEISKIDTTDIGNNRILLKYDYLVTAFDSALYLLPPFKVISGVDTAYSNELALKVSTLPVDVESKQFYDIKEIIKPKFVLMDYLPIILYILLGLVLAAAIAYIIYRIINKKSLIPFKKEEPYVPPHVRAIRELDAIKIQKLWQQGRMKEYHSDITDTLRKYIESRFEVGAMEMTSGEILDKLRGYSDADISYDNLKQILLLADFVKFAKYNPLPDENELSLMNAYLFVNNTKKEEIPAEVEGDKEKNTDKEEKNKEKI
ncbi:hypothetical protein FACS189426_19010 [Bacteroidia bacterium]|nr:hypothetical protein FACS189426_19010 [Bacteroidia bacterium]GHV70945.1 hypothetical protein FACS189420_4120 [Bacteroidia bacterium]